MRSTSKYVIISMALFFVTHPLATCKSLSSNHTNTTTSLSAQERHFLRKIKDIINLKARANVLKECNTTKEKVLAEIIKRFKQTLQIMSANGMRRRTPKLRVKDLVRQQTAAGSFTRSSTNQRKRRIMFRNMQCLSLNARGKVEGSTKTTGNETIFLIKTRAPQVVMIQSYHTKKYIAMDKHGHIHAKTNPDDDTLFYMRSEENNFMTLASYKYYLLCPYDMFLAIRYNGSMRSPHQSVPGQESTQLILVPVK